MSNFISLKKLQEKRTQKKQHWTRADEKQNLAAIIAIIHDKNVTKIAGNEAMFLVFFEEYSAAISIFEGFDVSIRKDRAYHLLYYFYSKLLQEKESDQRFAGEEFSEFHKQLSVSDVMLQDEDLHFFLGACGTSLTGNRVCDTNSDNALAYIILALHDRCLDHCKTKQDNQQVYEMFVDCEKKFNVALFFITVFANNEYVDPKYGVLTEKCKNDEPLIIGMSEPGFYLDIWRRICNNAIELKTPSIIDGVLSIGQQIYNTQRTFALINNLCCLESGGVGDGEEGLIATFLRFGFLITFRNDMERALKSRLMQNFRRMYGVASEENILLRFEQIFSASNALNVWCELTDSVSGRIGDGAARIALAFEKIGLPDIGCSSFFYHLDLLQRVNFLIDFVDGNKNASENCLVVGPTEFRVQVAPYFAKFVGQVLTPDFSKPTLTMQLVYSQEGSIFSIRQRVYLESFGQNNRIFLPLLLKEIAEKPTNDAMLLKLMEAHKKKLGEFGTLQTFFIDWSYLYDYTTDALLSKLTNDEKENLRKEMQDCLLAYKQALDAEQQKEREQLEKETSERQKYVHVDQHQEDASVKKASTVYRDDQSLIGIDLNNKKISANVEKSNSQHIGNSATISNSQNIRNSATIGDTQVDEDFEEKRDPDDDVDDKQPSPEKEKRQEKIEKKTAKTDTNIDQPKAKKREREEVIKQEKPAKINSFKQEEEKKSEKKKSANLKDNAIAKKVGRKRKISSDSIAIDKDNDEEEKVETFPVSHIISNDNDAEKPSKAERKTAIFYYNWPLMRDVVVEEGIICQNSKEVVEKLAAIKEWNCLFPFVHPNQVAYWQVQKPDEFIMNMWKVEHKDWPQELQKLQSCEEFEAYRKLFLNNWVKKVWKYDTRNYLVHLGNKKDPLNTEVDRLILGCGFLIFPKTLLEKNFEKSKLDMLINREDLKYSWLTGEEAKVFLEPKNQQIRNVIFDPKRLAKRPDGIRITEMTVDDLINHFGEAKKSTIVPLPLPKSGTSMKDSQISVQNSLQKDGSLSSDEESDDDAPISKKSRISDTPIEPVEPFLGVISVAKNCQETKIFGRLVKVRMVERTKKYSQAETLSYWLLLDADYQNLVFREKSIRDASNLTLPLELQSVSLFKFPFIEEDEFKQPN